MLTEDFRSARAERAAQPDDRRRAEEFGEQQPDHVEQAYCEKHERQADKHTIVVAHDFVHAHPLVRPSQVIVEGTLESSELFLLTNIVVDEALEGFDALPVRQLDPILNPHAVALQELLERIQSLVAPAIRVAGAARAQTRA